MGITDAVLKQEEAKPDVKEELMMSTMRGHKAGKQALTKVEGMGSREQEEGLASETNLVT